MDWTHQAWCGGCWKEAPQPEYAVCCSTSGLYSPASVGAESWHHAAEHRRVVPARRCADGREQLLRQVPRARSAARMPPTAGHRVAARCRMRPRSPAPGCRETASEGSCDGTESVVTGGSIGQLAGGDAAKRDTRRRCRPSGRARRRHAQHALRGACATCVSWPSFWIWPPVRTAAGRKQMGNGQQAAAHSVR